LGSHAGGEGFALGNGVAAPRGAHAGTFRGNHLAFAAGLATLRLIRSEDLPRHAARMGTRLLDGLSGLRADFPFVGYVRGRGLMVGLEVVEPDQRDGEGRPRWDGEFARLIQSACLSRGLIVELGGRGGAVLRFLPPLVTGEADIDTVVGIVGDACATASRSRG
jgi:diaminobutyrate-2-oxoglutarate transaminase